MNLTENHLAGEVNIRSARQEDVPALLALARELAAHEGESCMLTEADLLRDGFGEQAAFSVLVAEHGGEAIGFALFYTGYDLASATRGYHLGDLVVARRFRRKGAGRALIAALAKETLAKGGQWIAFTVLKKNATAQAFYRQLKAQTVEVDFMAWGERSLTKLVALAADCD